MSKIKLESLTDDTRTFECTIEHAQRLLRIESKIGVKNWSLPKGYKLEGEKIVKVKATRKKSNVKNSESIQGTDKKTS